jgi:hypothetical protein
LSTEQARFRRNRGTRAKCSLEPATELGHPFLYFLFYFSLKESIFLVVVCVIGMNNKHIYKTQQLVNCLIRSIIRAHNYTSCTYWCSDQACLGQTWPQYWQLKANGEIRWERVVWASTRFWINSGKDRSTYGCAKII